MADLKKVIPDAQEIAEAKRNQNGWVYRISGQYDINENIPPEAIVGAWKVDQAGVIVGDFISNPKSTGSE